MSLHLTLPAESKAFRAKNLEPSSELPPRVAQGDSAYFSEARMFNLSVHFTLKSSEEKKNQLSNSD